MNLEVNFIKGEKTPVVFIHGNSQNSTSGKALLEFFKEKGHSVLSYDLPGHGNSLPYEGEVTMDRMVDSLKEIIKKYKLKKPILSGHSMGAMISLQYAVKNQDNLHSLILIEASNVDPRHIIESVPIIEAADTIAEIVTMIPLKTLVDKIIQDSETNFKKQFKFNFSSKPMNEQEVLTEGLKYTEFNALKKNFMAFEHFDIRKEKITIPTLLLWAEQDILIPKEITDSLLKNLESSKLEVIHDLGHNWFLEKPELLVNALEKNYSFITGE